MNGWELPECAEIGGREYAIHADFRDILDLIEQLQDEAQPQAVRCYVALALFYEDFEQMPSEDYESALRWMYGFIDAGTVADDRRRPKTIDWQQDMPMIAADINRVAGCEVRVLPFCHWWTFIGWFNSIGDGQLSTVVSIREKRRKGKKLEPWEREFYRENRQKIDFKREAALSKAEADLLDLWTKGR